MSELEPSVAWIRCGDIKQPENLRVTHVAAPCSVPLVNREEHLSNVRTVASLRWWEIENSPVILTPSRHAAPSAGENCNDGPTINDVHLRGGSNHNYFDIVWIYTKERVPRTLKFCGGSITATAFLCIGSGFAIRGTICSAFIFVGASHKPDGQREHWRREGERIVISRGIVVT